MALLCTDSIYSNFSFGVVYWRILTVILKVPPQKLPFSTKQSVAKLAVITKGDFYCSVIFYYHVKFQRVGFRCGMQVCMAEISGFEAGFCLAYVKDATLSIEARHWL